MGLISPNDMEIADEDVMAGRWPVTTIDSLDRDKLHCGSNDAASLSR